MSEKTTASEPVGYGCFKEDGTLFDAEPVRENFLVIPKGWTIAPVYTHPVPTAAPQPVRKLREYYSETLKTSYRVRDGVLEFRHNEGVWDAPTAINVKDVSAVADLMCDPYDPVETVEDIVRDVVRCGTMDFIDSYATRLRAAVAAEGVRDV